MTFTDLTFLDEGKQYPPDPARNLMYKENIAIRENRFNDCWVDYNRKMREDNSYELKTWLGYFWRSTQRSMDFLLGKELKIGGAETGTESDDKVNEFVLQSDIHQTIFEAMVDCDTLGDGLLKIYKDKDGKAILQSNCPTIWEQVVEPGNFRRVQYHVLMTEFVKSVEGEEDSHYVKVEIHSKDAVEHRIYQLTYSGAMKTSLYAPINDIGQPIMQLALFGPRLPFEQFRDQFPDTEEVETHNLGDFLIVPISNIRTSRDVYGRSAYSLAAKSIAKQLIDRYNQIDRVLDKHSDPNMIGPKGMLELNPITHKPMMRGGGRYFGYRHDPDMVPPKVEYITWDGNLIPAETSIVRQINDLFNELELPPVSMAKDTTGVVSGSAYRLMLSPLLAKVGRLERSMVPNVIKAIKIALRYQGTPVEDVTVEVQDALPVIPNEEAQRISLLAASGLFAGSVGVQYLLEQAGVPEDIAESIAGTALAEAPPMTPAPEMGKSRDIAGDNFSPE